ncbi:hypothetical protein ACDW_17890 [Acidovorax sp. DW039]|uniref:hypothetical protein n=1 Tax=Acidovorax sp. DW039 TaxID=3095606 RepID=UPI003086471B|nr:hypothetical protein ACDW_17890 [Acidovorax sp. DW039]
MKFINLLFVAAVLSACGGGGGGESITPPPTPLPPTGTGTGTGTSDSVEIIKYAEGDTYTYRTERTDFIKGGVVGSEVSYYTYTLRNVKSNYEHERIYTAQNYFTSIENFNSKNFKTSSKYKGYRCTWTDGQDGPAFNLKVGQQWDSRYSANCTENVTAATDTHSKGSIVAKEDISTDAGIFKTYKAESVQEQKSTLASSVIRSTCWYDERTAMAVSCENHIQTTTTQGNTSEYSIKTKLVGLNVKNHVTKSLSPATYAGDWLVIFSGTVLGSCKVKIAPAGDMSGYCSSNNSYVTATGKISGDGKMVVRKGADEFSGRLTNGVEVSDTASGTSPYNYSIQWTAVHE